MSARPRRRDTRPPLRLFRVALAAHELAGRWTIGARRVRIPAANEQHAALIVVREAHATVGAPPWKPLVRQSLQYVRVGARVASLPARRKKPAQRKPDRLAA
jgi:hypothetical protein